ncbi:ATPase [Mycobacterium sp. 852014-50255_SCH5639931]|uniref:ATPase n=1 Tax=Mycobacterium sp. 852014-50255_SCH5639931 TaxID=1834112 RepID=UPI000802071A|nr:ATPase [Mycobacterium sp. 852014-50255_SCH5639931]OBB69762.1 ATPase [Mycobacterium sp. 852014-50255_SCH5639931]
MAEMRQLHDYDCAPTGVMPMRVILATMVVVGGLAVALIIAVPAPAEPQACPPVCDQIPDSAWIQRRAVPLDPVYSWPPLAGLAAQVTGSTPGPRFRFEEVCATPPVPRDPRDSAVVARATVAHPDGQWQLQAQILHWRGDTASGGAIAGSVFSNAVAALRSCQQRAPLQSPSITSDETNRMAAVISGPVVMHTYLLAHPASSTISELTLWSSGPPQVSWPAMADDPVLNAMTAPLCEAYIASCP